MASLLPLVASSALEVGVIAVAGWELWKLRTPKAGSVSKYTSDFSDHHTKSRQSETQELHQDEREDNPNSDGKDSAQERSD